jgi:putative exporter of polyketide antibiotics
LDIQKIKLREENNQRDRERQERLGMAVNLKKKMMLGWPSMCGRI